MCFTHKHTQRNPPTQVDDNETATPNQLNDVICAYFINRKFKVNFRTKHTHTRTQTHQTNQINGLRKAYI